MITKILTDLKALGYSITLEGNNIRLRYLGIGEHPAEAAPIIEVLKASKAEAVEYLKSRQPLPYFDLSGDLVIPFGCDSRYQYWAGGQSIKDTVENVKAWKH